MAVRDESPRAGGQRGAPGRSWGVQGIVTLESGRTITVASLREFDNSNTGRPTLGFSGNDRGDLIGNPMLDDPSPEQWFNTAASFWFPPVSSRTVLMQFPLV